MRCCVASRTTLASRSSASSESILKRRWSSRPASTSSGGRRASFEKASAGSSGRAKQRWTRRPSSGRRASSVKAFSSPTTPTTGVPRPGSIDVGLDALDGVSEPPLILGMLHCLRGECDVFNGDLTSAVVRTQTGLEISSLYPGHVGPRLLLVERGPCTAGGRGRGRRHRALHGDARLGERDAATASGRCADATSWVRSGRRVASSTRPARSGSGPSSPAGARRAALNP